MPRPPRSRPPCSSRRRRGGTSSSRRRPAPARRSPSASRWRRSCSASAGGAGFAREPLALIIAPTRELALQVSRELAWLYAPAGARIATCVGGMDAFEGAAGAAARRAYRRRHAGAASRPSRARRARSVEARGGRSRRGRRDARHGLSRGSRGDTRRDSRRPGGPCSSRRPCRGRSSLWPSATRRTRCGSRRSARSAAMATSPIRR